MIKKTIPCIFLLLISFISHAEIKSISILYTNDLHSHLLPSIQTRISETRPVGGFANIATLVRKKKLSDPDTIYIDSGDYFSGPYVSTLTNGAAVIESMNYLGLDVACIGNHEFDHGWENTLEQLNKASFPIVNGNIFYKNSDQLFWDNPYVILNKAGLKIGVIGLHGKFAFYDTINFKMIEAIETRDEVYYLKKYIAELKPITDIIILSIHGGMPGRQSSIGLSDVERSLYADIMLAKEVSDLDIIITGHAHTGTPQALISNDTIIVSTNAYTSELGELQIFFDTEKKEIVSHKNKLIQVFDDEIKDDPSMLKEIIKWQNKVEVIASKPITQSTNKMERAYGSESNMGNMFADAMSSFDERIDFAMVNSGALRQDINAGTITKGDLISAFPFPNTLVMAHLSGDQIKIIFDHAAGMTNGVLQVSSEFQYSINSSGKATALKLNDTEIKGDEMYWVAAPNFVTQGGDGYLEFRNAAHIEDTGIMVVEIVEEFLSKTNEYQPLVENRIIVN